MCVAKIATIPGVSLFVRNKELVKHGRDNRDISVSFLYLTVIFVCALPACLSRCLPSNQLVSHHGMTVACYIPGISTDTCFHVAGNQCQLFRMMKQECRDTFPTQYTATVLRFNKNGKKMDFSIDNMTSFCTLQSLHRVLC